MITFYFTRVYCFRLREKRINNIILLKNIYDDILRLKNTTNINNKFDGKYFIM